MLTDITHVTLLVTDQSDALEFYTETLGLVVRDDVDMTEMGMEGRWLTVSPETTEVPRIALVEATTSEQRERVGSQVADYVNLVLATSDFEADYDRLLKAGVEFRGEPMENPWGTEVTFVDPYGNLHSLLEPAAGAG